MTPDKFARAVMSDLDDAFPTDEEYVEALEELITLAQSALDGK